MEAKKNLTSKFLLKSLAKLIANSQNVSVELVNREFVEKSIIEDRQRRLEEARRSDSKILSVSDIKSASEKFDELVAG